MVSSRSIGWALLCAWALALVVTTTASAQDPNFTNFETPQVKPIALAQLGSGAGLREVVLICNTPDNSVEIYDAVAPHAFIQRVPVGLGPATVRWVPQLKRFYTCNFDGDTVSVVRLELITTPTGRQVHGALERTVFVGDEPSDIAFDPGFTTAIVTLSGRSGFTTASATNLGIIAFDVLFEAPLATLPGFMSAVKAPRQVAWLTDNRIFVINHMGETIDPMSPSQFYDLDLWSFDPAAAPTVASTGNLGSTNHAFAMTSDGNTMVVVGTRARNHELPGEAAVAALPFGFVESRMWVLDTLPGAAPSVRAEAASGVLPGSASPLGRNLNRDYSQVAATPVMPSAALSQPTDVLIIESGGAIKTIALTAYHSDKITFLQPSASQFGGYAETQVTIPVLNPGSGYSTSGPRGLAHSTNTGLVYVACRLDNSLRVVNPNSGTITASVQLGNDPTPLEIRQGRVFLYNATNSSTSGFVSCGSCHIDARTDGLPWNLGVATAGPAFPPGIFGFDPAVFFGTDFPADKGPLITQTLQGLVNYPVNTDAQYLFTNAPYHWRGDKVNFQDFNSAFVGLLGRATQLTTAEMNAYTAFINTVRHPSNPDQALDRRVPGTIDPLNPNDWQTATGAKRGLQTYFVHNSDGGRSCSDCHSLPDGSDNLITEPLLVPATLVGGNPQFHPFETAALRNLKPREAILQLNSDISSSAWVVANFGNAHDGAIATASINQFNATNFGPFMPGNNPTDMADNLIDLSAYTRQFDWGIAPSVGLAHTIDPATPGANATAFAIGEDQVEEANIGLAVLVRVGTLLRGFWFDVTATPPAYREEGTGNLFTRAAIEAMATQPDSAVIIQATPLGSDRRMASPNGVATLLTGPAPSNVNLRPMAPMTYHTDIPLFDQFMHVNQMVFPPTVAFPVLDSTWAERTLQISAFVAGSIPVLHHEPPRRFRVVGDDIRAGAKLLVGIPTTTPGSFPVQVVVLDLFPTKHPDANQNQIWETEEDLDSSLTMAFLNGGPFAPDVLNTLLRLTSSPSLNPGLWNNFGVAVLNEDGTFNSTINFAPLTVQDQR